MSKRRAVILAVLAVTELALWLTVDGAALILATAVVLAVAVGAAGPVRR